MKKKEIIEEIDFWGNKKYYGYINSIQETSGYNSIKELLIAHPDFQN